MKSGAFQLLSSHFNVYKLHPNTHLYTGDEHIEFPGRTFEIAKTTLYSKKEMRAGITFDKANVAVRNFPESVAALRKRWKIQDGGKRYIFFTTVEPNIKMMLLCKKITK